jgi:mannose-6-phosphate isomerase-like protein (cupin superfamily)
MNEQTKPKKRVFYKEAIMPRGTVVKIQNVMPFSAPGQEHTYISRMLIDQYNSSSKILQVNHGVLKAGEVITPSTHRPPHDELYIVLSGRAVLYLDGVEYDIEKGSVVFIPGGTPHGLTNKSRTEDFEIVTVWSCQPEPGANGIYDLRKQTWGTTYREVESK